MTALHRVPAGVPAGGQFATTAHAEADVTLTEAAEPARERVDAPSESGYVTVQDASGDDIDLIPGLIDDEARYVYKNGQCLALAVAISRHTGWPMHVTTYDGGEEPDEYAPTGFAQVRELRHASVFTPAGDLLDITGQHDPDAIELYEGDEVEVVAADEADRLLEEHGSNLEPGDLDVASQFVQAVLDLNE